MTVDNLEQIKAIEKKHSNNNLQKTMYVSGQKTLATNPYRESLLAGYSENGPVLGTSGVLDASEDINTRFSETVDYHDS